MCTELSQGREAEGTFPAGAGTSRGRDQEPPRGRDQLPQLRSEGFHLIKGNRKASPRVEAVPIWLRRWALLQLAARKGEYWEMRSLGVIKAPRSAPLPGRGWLLSSRQQLLSSWRGEQGSGAGSMAGHPAWARLSLGQGALARHGTARLVPLPRPLHVWEPSPDPTRRVEPIPTQDPQRGGGSGAGCCHPQELSTPV